MLHAPILRAQASQGVEGLASPPDFFLQSSSSLSACTPPQAVVGGWEGKDSEPSNLLQKEKAGFPDLPSPLHHEILSCLLILSQTSEGQVSELVGTEMQLMGNLGNRVPQFSINMSAPPLPPACLNSSPLYSVTVTQ